MGLTPLDVENTRFRGALAGYNRAEVDQYMHRIAAALEEKLEEIQRSQQQIDSLERDVQKNREVEDLLRNSVILAQRTCDELISSAHQKSDLIIQEAQAEGQQIKQRYSELRSDREQFEYAFHGLLSGFLHRLEQGNPALNAPLAAPALAAQQPETEPVQAAASKPQHSPVEAEQPLVHAFESADTLLDNAPPAPRQPFAQQQTLPEVKLTSAQDQGVDRDADITDFESAVSDAKTAKDMDWEPSASPGDIPSFIEDRYKEPPHSE